MTETIKQRIDRETAITLESMPGKPPGAQPLTPFRPCPMCPGVLREEDGALKCWTCGSSLTSKQPGVK